MDGMRGQKDRKGMVINIPKGSKSEEAAGSKEDKG